MKKHIARLVGLISAVACCGAFAACNYEEDYEYEAINPGTLAAPTVEFKTAREDAAQNVLYREAYPTLEKYSSPVTVTVGVIDYNLESNVKPGTRPQTQSFNDIALKELNIKIEYKLVAPSTGYDQKLNLAIAADDMPDMFYTTTPALFTLLRDTNMLADLTQSLYMLNDNLLSNYLTYFPDLLTACMKDGKLYALPQQTNQYTAAQRLYIRKDWLDIVGMDAPTTIDEMIAVGEAFLAHKNDIARETGISAANVIPFSMHKDITYAGSYSAEGMFNAHGASLGSFFLDDNGKLHSSNTSSEARAAVQTMRTMYEKGILDSDFIKNTSANVQSFVSAGFVGMVFGEWWLPKDALGTAVSSSSVKGADWTWVDLPTYGTATESLPVVDRMLISGYNLVSSKCRHPEAVAKLVNLFYDIYYNDDAQKIYGNKVQPENGFYYQFVPVKVWDGMASAEEFKRVNAAFDALYEGGLSDRADFTNGLREDIPSSAIDITDGVYTYKETGEQLVVIGSSDSGYNCIKRSVMQRINEDTALKAAFGSMRRREKILHFADGYPYFVAYKNNIPTKDMTKSEKEGWGIYHEMVDPEGSFAYVVELSEKKKNVKYDEFYGAALTAMQDKGEYINTQTSVTFTKIITKDKPMSEFESFVDVYNRNGGETIEKQVNQWYRSVHKFD